MSASFTIHDGHLGLFTAQSGAVINFLQPEKSDIRLFDIAHGLSNICRFGGHISSFYSVAQHSLLVYALAPNHLRKAALLHDASEAYLGDVVTPLKHILGDTYKSIELKFQQEIARIFEVDIQDFANLKEYDHQALEIEAQALKEGNWTHFDRMFEKHFAETGGWKPSFARQMYLSVAQILD